MNISAAPLPSIENNNCLFGIFFVFLVQIILYTYFKIPNNENKDMFNYFLKILLKLFFYIFLRYFKGITF